MSNSAIRCEKIGKQYEIGEGMLYAPLLRDVLANAVTAPVRMFRKNGANASGRKRSRDREKIWALRDISFEIHEGEATGLIGANGAGKSTLLKILARVTRPTTGHAVIHGRIGSLLEVGTGFHPELTGRENCYFSGSILGMSKREIDRKFDEIVAFAEVEKFIDTPIKHYSSGMQLRLAFAVAAHLEPEIILVDEVLTVGDMNFQKKCITKMESISRSGRTIVFVSHQINQVRRLCQKVAWLDKGEIRDYGPTGKIVAAYESAMAISESDRESQKRPVRGARFVDWQITQPACDEPHVLSDGEPVQLQFRLRADRALEGVHQGTALFGADNQLLWAAGTDGLKFQPGEHILRYNLPALPLRPGSYRWLATLYEDGELIDWWECTPEMIVATKPVTHRQDEWNGILNIPYELRVEINGR
jgi:lipopolysaccharide transport system ATP-binding protein